GATGRAHDAVGECPDLVPGDHRRPPGADSFSPERIPVDHFGFATESATRPTWPPATSPRLFGPTEYHQPGAPTPSQCRSWPIQDRRFAGRATASYARRAM